MKDLAEGFTEGESYTITVTPSYILEPTGIMMKGEIFTAAKDLATGRSYTEELSATGLNYYTAVIKKGPSLRVEVTGLSEYAELLFFDTRPGGRYSSAQYGWNAGTRNVEINGLSKGTACYFYVSADSVNIQPGHRFRMSLTEY